MTPIELVREMFPDATEDEADFILWERTAFPFNDIEGTRAQIMEFKQAIDKHPNARFCDFCSNLALVKGCCATCWMAFDNMLLLTA
ncbi:MAG: hypothetical protein AABN95_08025 [Acidobacteriota bacterium]